MPTSRSAVRSGPSKVYTGKGGSVERQEPLGVLDDPARVDAHVVGHHVAGQADAAGPGPVAEHGVGVLAAEIVGDPVVVERVGGRDRFGVAAHPLDPLGRLRAFPESDEPEPGDAPAGEGVELLVGDGVERPDGAAVGSRQLVQPDVRALGDQDDPGHPRRIRRERLRLVHAAELRRLRATGPAATAEAQMERRLLLGDHAERHVHPGEERGEGVAEHARPVLADVAKLSGE